MQEGQATSEVSYASSAQSRAGRAFVRIVENLTGRISLIRRADGYAEDVAAGRDFWQVMLDRYGLRVEIRDGALDRIPRHGPCVVVANHPFGILDGLVMGHILTQARGPQDFRIIAHGIFQKAEEINRLILPISFDGNATAQRANIETRNAALSHLREGGCVGLFPGGTVSTARRLFGPALDPGWRRFTARMIARSGATVVPVFFEGANSRLFQIASHISYSARLALMIREFGRRTDRPVGLRIGTPIDPDEIAARAAAPAELMDFLRRQTYELSDEQLAELGHGYEFEEHHRAPGEYQGALRY